MRVCATRSKRWPPKQYKDSPFRSPNRHSRRSAPRSIRGSIWGRVGRSAFGVGRSASTHQNRYQPIPRAPRRHQPTDPVAETDSVRHAHALLTLGAARVCFSARAETTRTERRGQFRAFAKWRPYPTWCGSTAARGESAPSSAGAKEKLVAFGSGRQQCSGSRHLCRQAPRELGSAAGAPQLIRRRAGKDRAHSPTDAPLLR